MSQSSSEGKMPVSLKERAEIINEVALRVLEEKKQKAAESVESALEYVINDTLYNERIRLKSESQGAEDKAEVLFLNEIAHALPRASEEDKERLLERIIRHYADDVAGRFDPKVYDFSTRILPFALSTVFSAASPAALLRTFPNVPDLSSRIIVRGELDRVRKLAEIGTVILLPTHVSNLDSIVMGWSLFEAGLPPVNYGAGKNLFANKFLSFFMNSLGAYKVDRRLRHSLYKDVLKAYSTAILERGFHSLFFPGGTRSRSGAVEKKLKMGLMSTGLSAYIDNLKAQSKRPNIYFIPATINYHLVLEAETLIEDYLQEVGKSRYIILDDEFSKPERVIRFMMGMLNMEASLIINFATPLDPFGNIVDEQGRSLDEKGRVIDISRYVRRDGEPVSDMARDMEYTMELTDSVVRELNAYNIALPTHVAGFALFRLMKERNPGVDLYRLLRSEGKDLVVKIPQAKTAIQKTADALLELAGKGKIRLGGPVRPGECATEIFADAFRYFTMYHTRPVLRREGDNLILNDMNLIYYYHNRLTGYGLERALEGGMPNG